ncbi:DUF397 domain-containing protein [Streptomyces sp. CA-250714]|uniref:DUF397 domain-containing protein n=1 Tax=Streptomyces sp. CA-250714 TaxID=3240060 RepID=UPI003D8FB3AE
MTNHDLHWFKSSYSNNGGNCLEWAPELATTGAVPVRDSKDTNREPLRFSAAAWTAFVGNVKHAQR